MKKKKYEVTSCLGCPYGQLETQEIPRSICIHKKFRRGKTIKDYHIIPKWCPLDNFEFDLYKPEAR